MRSKAEKIQNPDPKRTIWNFLTLEHLDCYEIRILCFEVFDFPFLRKTVH